MTLPRSILFWAFVCLFFIVSLIPFNTLSAVNGGGAPYHHVVFGSVLFVLFAAAFIIEPRLTRFDLLLLAVSAGFFLSSLASIDRSHSILLFAGFFIRGIAVAFIAERVMKGRVEMLTRVILFTTSAVALIGLVEFIGLALFDKYLNPWSQYFFAHGVYSFGNFARTGRSGITSTIGHPLPLAAYLVLALPLAVWFLQNRARNILSAVPSMLVAAAILLSFSRSSWISAFAAMAWYLLQPYNVRWAVSHRRSLFAAGLILLSVVLIPTTRRALLSRASLDRVKAEIVDSERTFAYGISGRIFLQHPLSGIGLGNYGKVKAVLPDSGSKDPTLLVADNMYLTILAETGLLGTIPFILFTAYWFPRLGKHRQDPFLLAVFSGLLGFSVNLAACELFYWAAPQFLFWMLLGSAIGLDGERNG